MSRKAERQARMQAERDLKDAKADAKHWRGRAAKATGTSKQTFERGAKAAEGRAADAQSRLRGK